ncbi:MAG: HD domain-containing protein [Candidatus Promineifilaceae bacterium]|nr:HD domain-containing protein [Candidatus Promineifilaceae bacterium]
MEYHDPVYGFHRIEDPLLLDIMNSAAMQRLRYVLQHGISGLLGVTRPTTRFEHSVGTMLLVRRLGADLAEQAAALLHDVSHTAFSHVVDYVFGGHDSQGFHDLHKAEYVAETDLPEILAKHGYDWRWLIREDEFSLLEQPAPALCADRLDYFLRDAQDLGLVEADQIRWVLSHLAVHSGRIAANDLTVAQWLAYTYIEADEASWANFREVGLYELTARAIRRALDLGALSQQDLWGTDEQLWQLLQGVPDPELQRQLTLIHPDTGFIWDDDRPVFRISTKLRTVDPDVIVNGQLKPLSTLDQAFARFRSDYLRSKSGKWPMRIVAPDAAASQHSP